MDIVFDIDGTLANPDHRLHFISEPVSWTGPFKRDWTSFLSDEEIAKDTPIPAAWELLYSLLNSGNRILFITGRPESQRVTTFNWLMDTSCEVRAPVAWTLKKRRKGPFLFMRSNGDHRPSSDVKENLLHKSIKDGFSPAMAFEDRATDTEMWRRNGLFCCQVADGNY